MRRYLCLLAAVSLTASSSFAQEIFRDDFNGGSVDLSKWQVMTHIVGRSQFGNTPVVSGGFARLKHDTYNAQAPGARFRGTELATNAFLSRGANGIELEARVRSNAMTNGLVTSFFTYISRSSGGTILWDEIDFEFLSNRTNAVAGSDPVLTSTYNDFNLSTQPYGDEVTQSSREHTVNALNLTQFNTFRIKWLNNRLEWYTNGRLMRTVTGSLVPTDATRARFNFWAPGNEWGAAYSSALNPTSIPANNQSAFYDVDWMVVRNARPAVTATSADRVFTDRFNNGQVANADSQTGFWTQRSQGASTVVESSAEPLKLTAAGGGYPHAQITSSVRSEFNLFESPIEIEATGIDFTSSTNSYSKAFLRFALSSESLAQGSQSEYTSEDAFSLRIGADQSVALGFKVNSPNVNTEFEATNLLNQTVSGPVRRVSMVVNPTFYTLKVEHDLSLADGTPTVTEFSGNFSISLNDWRKLASAATGDSALYVQSQLSNAAANETATAFVESLAVNAIKPTWNQSTGGDWNSTANWSRNMTPNYSGANAILGNAIVGTQTLTINSPVTVGKLTLDSAGGYTLAGPASLTLQTHAAVAKVNAVVGNHRIDVPVLTAMPTLFTVSPGATLTLSGGLDGAAGSSLTKTGTGTLAAKFVRADMVAIDGGAVRIEPSPIANAPSGASVIQSLTFVGSAAAPTTSLDLSNNALVIDYATTSPMDDVRQLLLAGTTAGKGIISSLGSASLRIGYAEASVVRPGGGAFAGQTVDATAVVLAFTYAGDGNLDGSVNLDDFTALAGAFGSSNASWTQGDFDYNASVDLNDFTTLAANFGNTFPAAGFRFGTVPEPATGLVLLGLLVVTARRRDPHRG